SRIRSKVGLAARPPAGCMIDPLPREDQLRMTVFPAVFDLPERLIAKSDPALIAADEAHFARIAESLASSIADLTVRLNETLKQDGGDNPHAVLRDDEVRRLSSRLQSLRRYGLDLCLGRIVTDDGSAPVYIGRIGLTDTSGERLL